MITTQTYKKSRFNIFVACDNGDIIIFNTLTGALGKFDQSTLKRYNENQLSESEINLLVQKGILIPEDFDEMQKINDDRLFGINNEKTKHYRIWPTSSCNARCYYCFEKGIKTTTMTHEVADTLIKSIYNTLNENDTLKLEWFGGEPLLNIEVIDYIYTKLQPLCHERKCNIYSTIITNGSLINEKLAYKMRYAWDIKLAQITLDGYGEAYNNAKNYYKPTLYDFNGIIKSIKFLANHGIHVTVRMNYDTHNYDSLVELIDFLHLEFKDFSNISYYIYPVWSSIEADREDSFCSNTKADINLLALFDLLVKYGMCSAKKIAGLTYKRSACQAWSKNSYTVLPSGEITKCAEAYNQIIGDVWKGVTDSVAYDFWTDDTLEAQCENCVYLPLCQGGCKSSHFNRMPQCFALKPIFEDILKWYVHHLDCQQSA